MCEYCGCQAVSTIAELTAEHDEVVRLIAEVRTALGAKRLEEAAALTRAIAAVLDPHTAVEEGGLFPAMAQSFPEHSAALEAEHRQVEAVLGESASGTPADPSWPARLVRTLDVLRDHILKEQDGVFPAALSELEAQDWERVEAVRKSLAAPAVEQLAVSR